MFSFDRVLLVGRVVDTFARRNKLANKLKNFLKLGFTRWDSVRFGFFFWASVVFFSTGSDE